MSLTEEVDKLLTTIFDKFDMTADADSDDEESSDSENPMMKFKSELNTSFVSLIEEKVRKAQAEASTVTRKSVPISIRPNIALKNTNTTVEKKKGNYYSIYFGSICAINRDLKADTSTDLDLTPVPDSLKFRDPTHKLKDNQKKMLESLNKSDTEVVPKKSDDETDEHREKRETLQKHKDLKDFETDSVRELYVKLQDAFKSIYAEIQLAAIIWNFFMSDATREEY